MGQREGEWEKAAGGTCPAGRREAASLYAQKISCFIGNWPPLKMERGEPEGNKGENCDEADIHGEDYPPIREGNNFPLLDVIFHLWGYLNFYFKGGEQ